MKISELTDTQKSHLAWRLDHKTCMGLGSAARTARGKMGDMDLVEVFKLAGSTEHSAKIHARKVMNFNIWCACCGKNQTNDQMSVVAEGERKEHCCSTCTERVTCEKCGATPMRGDAHEDDNGILCEVWYVENNQVAGISSSEGS